MNPLLAHAVAETALDVVPRRCLRLGLPATPREFSSYLYKRGFVGAGKDPVVAVIRTRIALAQGGDPDAVRIVTDSDGTWWLRYLAGGAHRWRIPYASEADARAAADGLAALGFSILTGEGSCF